jgi:hypothetical protein
MVLKPGEAKRTHLIIDMPPKTGNYLEDPYDGMIKGRIMDSPQSAFTGLLFNARVEGNGLKGQMSINTDTLQHITGLFGGNLELTTGAFKGKIQYLENGMGHSVQAEGCLRPIRIINISQYHKGEAVGGLSVQVQVPLPPGNCFEELPDTDVLVRPEGSKEEKRCLDSAEDIVKCLNIKEQDVCSVKVKSVIVEIKFRDSTC